MSVVDQGATQADAAARFGLTRAAVQYWVAKGRRERESAGPELLPVRLGNATPVRVERVPAPRSSAAQKSTES